MSLGIIGTIAISMHYHVYHLHRHHHHRRHLCISITISNVYSSNTDLDAEVLETLRSGRFRQLEKQLCNAVKLEKLVESHREFTPALHTLRALVTEAFSALRLPVIELLDGPSGVILESPVDILFPCHEESQQQFSIAFTGAELVGDNGGGDGGKRHEVLQMCFELRPPLALSMNVAAKVAHPSRPWAQCFKRKPLSKIKESKPLMFVFGILNVISRFLSAHFNNSSRSICC